MGGLLFSVFNTNWVFHMWVSAAQVFLWIGIICFSSPPGLRGPLNIYLYIFYLSFMIKITFMHKWCGLWWGRRMFPRPTLRLSSSFFSILLFIWLEQLCSEKKLLPIWICSRGRCVYVSNIMISFCCILLVKMPHVRTYSQYIKM